MRVPWWWGEDRARKLRELIRDKVKEVENGKEVEIVPNFVGVFSVDRVFYSMRS
jgi:hypothetical protein